MTVLEALNTNTSFTKKIESLQKEIVIQRPDRAAVNTDFPCCLIEKDEILTITFIKKDITGQQTHKALSHRRTDLVTFNIKTTGGKNVIYIMKSNELKKTVDYVCVYGLKGEEVKTALERDGRFIDKIFNEKHCVLSENNALCDQTKYEMSHTVEYLDKKIFQIICISHNPPASKLKKQTEVKNESDVASNPSVSAKNDPDQNPISTDQKETLHNKESTSLSTKWPVIPHSTEILKILRDQFKDLLETLKQRNPQVQKFFRAEYDKSVQSFSEVYKIKQLMSLSDSVCQIRVEGFPKGTGFLLFGRFVLTNAHVVRNVLESPDKLSSAKHLQVAFDFEHLDSQVKLVPVKKQLAAYCFITDANNSRLDFALLELATELDDVVKITGRPELLNQHIPGLPRNRGGICIVGHPDSGIKRMDPCFIIENLQEAADEHISENVEFIQVMTQRSLEDKWGVYENQITYDSCFFYGSSGSPVFDEDCNLIGVHTGGYVYEGKDKKRKTDKDRSIMEYAYSIQPILDMIRAQAKIKGLHEVVNTLEAHSLRLQSRGPQDSTRFIATQDSISK